MEMTNCTVVGDLNQSPVPIDLLSAEPIRNFEAVKLRTERATFLIYKSGKVVCVGASNPEVASEEFNKLPLEITTRLNANVERISQFLQKRIQATLGAVSNVVCHGGFNQSIRLDRIFEQYKYHSGVVYEPELYPALKLEINSVTLLLFTSGKVIVTGAKDIKQAVAAYQSLCETLVLSVNKSQEVLLPPDHFCLTPMQGKPLAPLALQDVKRKSTSTTTTETSRRKKRNLRTTSPKETSRWSAEDWIDLFRDDLLQRFEQAQAEEASSMNSQGTHVRVEQVETLDQEPQPMDVTPELKLVAENSLPAEKTEDPEGKSEVPLLVEEYKRDVEDSISDHVFPFDLGTGWTGPVPVLVSSKAELDVGVTPVSPNRAETAKLPTPTVDKQQVKSGSKKQLTHSHGICPRLPKSIANSTQHLSLVVYFACKSCKAKSMVHPDMWLEGDDGRFHTGLSVCENCHSLNGDWYEAVCS